MSKKLGIPKSTIWSFSKGADIKLETFQKLAVFHDTVSSNIEKLIIELFGR